MSKTLKIRHILPRNVKIKIVLLFFGVLLGAQVEMLTIATIQPFIMLLTDPSAIYTNNLLNFAYTTFGFTGITPFFAFLAFMIAAVYAVRGLYVYFFTRIQNRITAQNSAQLANRLLVETIKQPYLYHANINITQLQRIVVRNSERFFGFITDLLALLMDVFMTISILGFLVLTSPIMTGMVLFLASICLAIYFGVLKSRIQESDEEEEKGQVAITKSIFQTFGGVKEIKIMQKDRYFAEKHMRIVNETIKMKEQRQSIRMLPKLLIESLCFSGAFVIISVVILLGVNMEMLLPQLGIFLMAAFKLLPAISRFTTQITMVIKRRKSVDQVFETLFEKDKQYDTELPEPEITEVSNDIVLSNIFFKYPKARGLVLKNLSLTIPHNKSVAFIGPSGAGKSTLLDIVLGILPPAAGSVVYDGKSIHHNFDFWAKNVGYVPQTIYLLDESILENVAFGIRKDKIDENKVWDALEKAQLKDFVEELPEGLLTQVGERGVRLSGGQRQRIGIARALYNNPSIFVLDEATSSLDVDTENAVMESIRAMQNTKTIIIVAHRLTTIEHCDIVYKIAKRRAVLVRSDTMVQPDAAAVAAAAAKKARKLAKRAKKLAEQQAAEQAAEQAQSA